MACLQHQQACTTVATPPRPARRVAAVRLPSVLAATSLGRPGGQYHHTTVVTRADVDGASVARNASTKGLPATAVAVRGATAALPVRGSAGTVTPTAPGTAAAPVADEAGESDSASGGGSDIAAAYPRVTPSAGAAPPFPAKVVPAGPGAARDGFAGAPATAVAGKTTTVVAAALPSRPPPLLQPWQ